MPTHEEADQFWRDWASLTPEQKRWFWAAVQKFVHDLESLPRGHFRGGLRVKPMQNVDGIFEMTWGPEDGRATFQNGEELAPGEPHIIWRRIGTHAIFRDP